ncbi:MAG: 16S rRNA (cytosine(1402)-N(4))-methyltransferase [Acidobacteria bacterium]|nr:MAG: 16S rRNA (cytosine(1402)-N(4))-methyltransferase [Acidobacteriota bacterium]
MRSRPSASEPDHLPVMCAEVVQLMAPASGGLIVDCTLGSGGHAEALLNELEPPIDLIGLDKDEAAIARAKSRLSQFGSRADLEHADFDDLEAVLQQKSKQDVAGILYDLGVSSPQLDRAERGFSYQRSGPLDMRMDASAPGISAREVVNEYEEAQLEKVISRFGDETSARRIAKEIVASRPIATTGELAEVVTRAIPAAKRRSGRHPARKTFQAIRIEVNGELDRLESSLSQAARVLKSPGGRIVAISYHSLEDRVVKAFIASMSKGCVCPPRLPACACGREPLMRPVTRRPMRPSAREIRSNRRAASARLRCAERTAAPARDGASDG